MLTHIADPQVSGTLCSMEFDNFVVLLGSIQAIFIIESLMEHIGETLGIPSETVKQKNLYEKGQVPC